MTDSDSSNGSGAFPLAGPVIAAFGGIRPMATRLDVPVSTVQGWKQRDAIPDNRFDQIRDAASADGIDLEALPAVDASAEDDGSVIDTAGPADTAAAAPADTSAAPSTATREALAGTPDTRSQNAEKASSAPAGNTSGPGSGAMPVAVLALVVALAAGGWVWWSQQPQSGASSLANEVAALKSEVAKLSVASDRPVATAQQLDALSGRLDDLAKKVDSTAANTTDDARLDALGSDISSVKAAIGDAQKSMLTTTAEMASLRTGVDNTMSDISARLVAVENRDNTAAAREARAVGLAIAANEIRRTLRSGASFAGELTTLRQLASGDADLAAPVVTLAASATDGLPSAAALARRFDTLIPAILSADRVHDEAPWYRQALDRVTGVISIRRVGADAGGDTVDAVVARAEAALADGDLVGAVTQVETLQGDAAKAAAAWLADAKRVVAAEAAVAQINSKALATLAASRSQ
ncbi:MAG: mitofilin family membrane protein [Alphaproteobacteria bacterium]